MKQSQLFTKTTKDALKDEVSVNAQLLIRAGFINKEMAGVYAYLPLGLRVIEKIKKIIREEMDAIGGQEIIMSSLQPKGVWESTGRWSDEVVDVWFKSKLKNGTDVGFGWSHEEPITEMMKRFLTSYRDFPAYAYQFQTKLRNELRAKSGIMRGREFVMKDLYSYDVDETRHLAFYESVKGAYMNVFRRVGLGDITYITFAAGGAFTKYSHEFQTITEAGEDYIYVNKEKGIAVNEEVLDDSVLTELGVSKNELTKVKSAEVGNIFNFGTAKCDDMNLFVTDKQGKQASVYLGSYGIGVTRLMGVVAEHFADERGMIWSEEIAPFAVHLLSLNQNEKAEEIYNALNKAGVEVLFDDRDANAGVKFADADLMGMPYQLVVSEKNIRDNRVEIKNRKSGAVEYVSLDNSEIVRYFGKK
ncbi:MAG: prolyl-tRNA synthetase [uncultured bacterium]|nr:MAG: prolyl-tRNA synthetase [uncultured bacterium]HCU70668.1 prolyl-tRNA synthetase [Candidatus Moranbacteria bacterium]